MARFLTPCRSAGRGPQGASGSAAAGRGDRADPGGRRTARERGRRPPPPGLPPGRRALPASARQRPQGTHRPLDPGVAAQIDIYLAWRAEHAAGDADTTPLLIRPDGRALTRDTISYRINRLYARAGIVKPDGEAAHALRHTYAVSMVDVGVPISEVQQLLGHESIATTGIYLKASAAHLRAASAAPSAARLLTGQ